MDPITGVAALAGLTIASLAGLRLKKQLDEGFQVLPSEKEESIAVSQTRYNPLMSMVNPLMNPLLPVDATKEQVETKQKDLNQALGSLLSPYDPSSPEAFKLKDMLNRLEVRSDPKGGLFDAVRFCKETVEKNDKPFTIFKKDVNGNLVLDGEGNPVPETKGAEQRNNDTETFKFDEICGVCLTSGIDEEGKSFNGKRGMLLDPSTKESALREQKEFQYPFPRVIPSMGKCEGSPNTPAFAVDANTLHLYTMRNDCMKSKEIKSIDDANACGLCFENDVYSVVPKNVQKNTINLVLMGIGRCDITVDGIDVKKNLIMNDKTAVSVPLVLKQGERVISVNEGSILRIRIVEDPSKADEIPIVWGYLRSVNPNGGEFAMPLNLIILRDDVTNGPPNRTGGFHRFPENDIEVSKIRPAAATGNTDSRVVGMTLVGEIPFTFVQPNEFSSFDCPSAPYQTQIKSVSRFSSDEPCYAKGSGKGKYNDDCLRQRILAVGCTNGGELYKNPQQLNTNDLGQPASLTEIYTRLQGIAVENLIDPDKTLQCSGKVIESPCEVFLQNPTLKMTTILDGTYRDPENPDAVKRLKPAVTKCLAYLYNNKGSQEMAREGQEPRTGSTYQGPQQFANDTTQNKKIYCLPTGELNPNRSTTALQELARIHDSGFDRQSGIKAVQKYLDSLLQMAIDEKRNGNTDPDRRSAIRKCFGTDFKALPVRQQATGNPVIQNDPPKYRFRDSQNRQWKMTADKRIRLTQGTTIEVDFVSRSDVYKNNEGRVGLFINGNPANAIRHSGFLLFSNPFTPNTLDFAWYPIRSANNTVTLYNDFNGGYVIGYDGPTDSLLLVRAGDSRAVFWKVEPYPTTFVRNNAALLVAPKPRIVFAWYGTIYKGIGTNVTSILQNIMNSGATQLTISDGTMGGDPTPGVAKRIWVDFVPSYGGTAKQFVGNQNASLRFSDLTDSLATVPTVTPPQDSLPTSFIPAFNQRLGTAWNNGDYELTMEINPSRIIYGDWGSIVQFTATGGQCCNPGDRIPGLWFLQSSLRLHVRIGDNTNGNWGVDTASSCLKDTWNRFSLVCQGNRVTVQLNKEQIILTQPSMRPRGVATVWSRLSYTPAGASIRNFRFRSLN